MTMEIQSDKKLSRGLLLLPLLLAAIVYIGTAAGRGVIDYDEGYYAQPALHMASSGDWVTPYANGVRFLEKPPLLYWLTAISFKIFGINEFGLRLPTALAVIALVWIVMLTARRLTDERGSFIAGLSAAFCVGTCLFTRETLHDIWLVFFVALAMYAFISWYLDARHSLRYALLFYAAMAGAVLCKSLIGLAFPVGIVILFFLISREMPQWRTLHLLPGSLLFLVLTVPWHWMAAVRNQDFLNFFFVGEQFLRFFGKREPPILWSMPVWLFWALVLVWFFPWTAFLPAAFAGCRKNAETNTRILYKLAIVWAGVILGFFSVSGRLEHYAFPALPALSLLVAGVLGRGGENKWILWAFRGLAMLGVLVLLAGAGAGIWLWAGDSMQIGGTGPSDRLSETDFSILAEMPRAVLANLIKPAVVTIFTLAIGFAVALWFEKRRQRMHSILSIAMVMLILCGMIHWSLVICDDMISSRKFALAIVRQAQAGDRIVIADDYESANSISFYTPMRVEIFGGAAYALVPGMKYPDAPKIILTKEEFLSAWQSNRRMFVLTPKERIPELNPDGIVVMDLLHRVLIKNH
jgi:4-amino-4-deoxy-L-arabinose transferase-like glycosyltransferase